MSLFWPETSGWWHLCLSCTGPLGFFLLLGLAGCTQLTGLDPTPAKGESDMECVSERGVRPLHGQTHWLLQRDQQLQLPAQVLALSKAAAGPGACKQLLWLAPANAVVPRSLKTPGTTGPKKGSHSSGLGSSQVRAPRGTTVRFSSLPATWKAKGYVSALCCSSFSSAIQQVPSSCPATKNSDKWRASKMKRSFVEQQSSSQ